MAADIFLLVAQIFVKNGMLNAYEHLICATEIHTTIYKITYYLLINNMIEIRKKTFILSSVLQTLHYICAVILSHTESKLLRIF